MKWLIPRDDPTIPPDLTPPEEAIPALIAAGANPALALAMFRFKWRMKQLGHTISFVQIWRSADTQAALYAQGRTTPGRIVTNAPPGYSPHECTENGRPASQAFDIAMREGHMLSWEVSDRTARFWSDARDTGRMCGLKWGGDLPAPPGDYGHFQLSTFTRVTK